MSEQTWKLIVKYFQISITSPQVQDIIINSKRDVNAILSVQDQQMQNIIAKKPTIINPKFIKWLPNPFQPYDIKHKKQKYHITIQFLLDQQKVAISQFQIKLKSAKVLNLKVIGSHIPFKFGQLQIEIQWAKNIPNQPKNLSAYNSNLFSNLRSQKYRKSFQKSDHHLIDEKNQQEKRFFSSFFCCLSKRKTKLSFNQKKFHIQKVYKYQINQVHQNIKESDRKRIINQIPFMTKRQNIMK